MVFTYIYTFFEKLFLDIKDLFFPMCCQLLNIKFKSSVFFRPIIYNYINQIGNITGNTFKTHLLFMK